MKFKAEAYIDEYVIDGENTGTFAGETTSLTYTPADPETWSSFSIPTDDISSITFKRNISLHRSRLLGWFFAAITVLLISVVYIVSFAGRITDPDLSIITVFFGFLIIGGLSTTYEHFTGETHDVIAISIRTVDGERHTVHGRMKNTDLVKACGELIDSDLETRNQNKTLERELSN